MSNIEVEFNAALSRYEEGEDLLPLVDDFKRIINQMINKLSIKEIVNLISLNNKISKKEIYNYCLMLKNEN